MTGAGAQDAAAETQQQRAIRAIEAIFSGGDLAAETQQLSNEFTDRQVERLKGALRRGPRGTRSGVSDVRDSA